MDATTKATHTPGPWIQRGDTVNAHRPHVCGGYNEESVLALSRDYDERVANARLIAAAPDMLAALKFANRECVMPALVRDAVRAAIAKAEGK